MSHIVIEEDSVTVPGGKVFVRKWLPDNPSSHYPIVLLHDSLGCVDLWRDFPKLLAESLNRSVIAYDRLGYGRSSARRELPSVDFIDDEARIFFPAVCKELALTSFALFGHSVGGAMALTIAALQKSRCNWVVTESAQSFVEKRTLAGILAAKIDFRRPGQFNKLIKWHGDKAQWVLDAWTGVWLSPSFLTWNLDPYLDKVRCPVLAIHGDLDEYGSIAFPQRIVSRVHGLSQLVILEMCGHVPHREQQQQVLHLALEFTNLAESRTSSNAS